MIAAIVIDIEGTTSPTSSVREKLYDYTRQHLGQWLADNVDGAADPVIAETRLLTEQPDASPAEVTEILCDWLNSDIKAGPLKTAQGLVCAEGFRSGALHGEFFADVPAALAAWHDMGIALHVFSSGSVRNQQDWFANARGGELASFDQRLVRPQHRRGKGRELFLQNDCHGNRTGPRPDPFSVRPPR